MMTPARLFSAALLLLPLLLGACGENRQTETPDLEISPAAFVFPKLGEGQSAVREVQVTNQGAGELVLTDLRLSDGLDSAEFTLQQRLDGSLVPLPDVVRLAGRGEEVLVLALRYAPNDDVADAGSVMLTSNDGANLEVSIPVQSGDRGGSLRVNPQTIDFGGVAVGDVGAQPLTLQNVGVVDLVISALTLSGSDDFSVLRDDEAFVGDLGDSPLIIGAGQSVELTATYAPAARGLDTGALTIHSNDPNSPSGLNVNFGGSASAACLRVVPDQVNFGSALLVADQEMPTPNHRALSVESCGAVPLVIDRIELERGDGAFRLIDPPVVEPGEPLIELPGADGADFPSHALQVGFWPTELTAYGDRLLIYSNAGVEPTPVDLFGRGVENACPLPVATETQYNVQPLEVIILDGQRSEDPGGTVLQWRWTVVARPDGSVSQPVERFDDPRAPADGGPADDEATPTAQFFVDLAGRYELELQVQDNLGQWSCDPRAVARIGIEAIPDKDLHIQLVWSTPEDPDETDGFGTDVDLHLRHERATRWGGEERWDCFFNNTSPDWGIDGDVLDNPSLDIDDTNGAGPENINLDEPEPGVTYEIGAIYYRSESTFGVAESDPRAEHDSYVTVRVFVRGEPIAEFVDKRVHRVRQLWRIASLTWCDDALTCPAVTIHDEVLEERDYAQP